jgi:hypothetical protein
VMFIHHKYGYPMGLEFNEFATGVARAKNPQVNIYGNALFTTSGELDGEFYNNCYHNYQNYEGLSFSG